MAGLSDMLRAAARDAPEAALLTVYVLLVVFSSKLLYEWLRRRGEPHNVAVYYVRKFIHVFAGGVVALLTPIVFESPLTPLILGVAMAAFLAAARIVRPMYWFQVPENHYEVNFALAWGVSVTLLWLATGDPFKAVVPAAFISFGDAATGVVRNALFKRRTKHWVGNLAMLAVTLPIGYLLAGPQGAIAAVIASIVERFEFGRIDDNVLITLAATLVLLAPAP